MITLQDQIITHSSIKHTRSFFYFATELVESHQAPTNLKRRGVRPLPPHDSAIHRAPRDGLERLLDSPCCQRLLALLAYLWNGSHCCGMSAAAVHLRPRGHKHRTTDRARARWRCPGLSHATRERKPRVVAACTAALHHPLLIRETCRLFLHHSQLRLHSFGSVPKTQIRKARCNHQSLRDDRGHRQAPQREACRAPQCRSPTDGCHTVPLSSSSETWDSLSPPVSAVDQCYCDCRHRTHRRLISRRIA